MNGVFSKSARPNVFMDPSPQTNKKRASLLGLDLPGSGEDGSVLLGDRDGVEEVVGLSAGSLVHVAHRVVVWAAVDVVLAAGGLWEWAAGPLEALSEDLLLAAAGVSGWAAVGVRALVGWWWGWWGWWRWWGWWGWWWVWSALLRVHGVLQDSALSGLSSGGHAELDVSLHSPAGSPAVLHDPVWLVSGGVVPDGEDSVVELVSAIGGEDSSGVVLEGGVVGLDGNADWLGGDGLLQVILAVDWDVLVSANGHDVVGLLLGVAGSSLGGVSVVILGVNTSVAHDVLEGVVHDSSVASHVDLVAVDELLLGKADELAGLDEVDSLHGTGGGEGPAGAALLLVLDWDDGSLLAPVDGGGSGDVGVGESGQVLPGLPELGLQAWVQVLLLVLLDGQVGEAGESQVEGLLLGVNLPDVVKVVGEDLEPLGDLLDVIDVGRLELLQPGVEVLEVSSLVEGLNVLWVSVDRDAGEGDGGQDGKDSDGLVHLYSR